MRAEAPESGHSEKAGVGGWCSLGDVPLISLENWQLHFSFLFLKFIWLHWALTVAGRIFAAAYGILSCDT